MSDDLVQRLRDASLVIQYPERSKIADRIEALEAELAVCREAIEVCLDVAEHLPSDDDGAAAVRRCTLRRLNEAVGKAVPRLMFERPEGQKLYGLNYMEMRAALAELLACHTESAGWSMSVLTDRAEFDAMLARSQERLEAAVGAAREALGPNAKLCETERRKAEPKVEPLFTHLPKHEPLTDEQIAQCIVEARVNGPFARAGTTSFRIARAVERAHGIGGSNE